LSSNATWRELAESVFQDDSDLEEAKAKEPIPDDGNEIEDRLRFRKEVQEPADRYTRKPEVGQPNTRSGVYSINVIHRP
jgi:hypothetical protein